MTEPVQATAVCPVCGGSGKPRNLFDLALGLTCEDCDGTGQRPVTLTGHAANLYRLGEITLTFYADGTLLQVLNESHGGYRGAIIAALASAPKEEE